SGVSYEKVQHRGADGGRPRQGRGQAPRGRRGTPRPRAVVGGGRRGNRRRRHCHGRAAGAPTMTATSAIVGLGLTEMGKVYGRTITDFAGEAIAQALEDAGLAASDIDGLLINANSSTEMVPMLQMSLGLEDLTLVNAMNAAGSTAGNMLQWATQAIDAGQASVVA